MESIIERNIGTDVQNMISTKDSSVTEQVKGKKREKNKKIFWKRVRRIIRYTLIGFTFLLLLAVGGIFLLYGKDITEWSEMMRAEVDEGSREDFIPSNVSYIYDKDGNELAKLSVSEKSMYLKYHKIPQNTINAFIAVEDRSYWSNKGYDIKGMLRVAFNAVKTKGETINGASTITQQLARKIYLSSEVSIERKIKEIIAAAELTEKYSKEDILEFYVNNCCFANNIYGIEAASQYYFDKSAEDLSLSQTAYLCAIPNRPTYYDPYKDPQRALQRRDKILEDMYECGYISNKERKQALKEEIEISSSHAEGEERVNNYQTTYAIDCVIKYLMKQQDFIFQYTFDTQEDYEEYQKIYNEWYAEVKEELYTGGYKIYTSLDSKAQETLQSILDDSLDMDLSIGDSGMYDFQGALTAIDNSMGKVIAIIGGRSQEEFRKSYTLNRAYQSYRQPGSSIKPLVVYLPALMKDYTADSKLKNIDVSAAKKSDHIAALGGTGMTLRNAVEQSKNGCAYWLFNEIGIEYGLSFLQYMKFDRIVPADRNLSSALGGLTYGVTTEQMAGAYAAVGNEGKYRDTTCITKIVDLEGRNIYEDEEEITVYDRDKSAEMIDVLKGVLARGTAASMKWSGISRVEAAGKTGTTNDSKDGWFCGLTPYFTISVWVGYDTPKQLSSLYGSSYPAAIWKNSMKALLEQYGYTEGTFLKTDMAESGQEEFLPGRLDSEVLSDGYTVGDYRADRKIGKEINAVIAEMHVLDSSSEDYQSRKDALYQKGKRLVEDIYSVKYTAEMQQALQESYGNY